MNLDNGDADEAHDDLSGDIAAIFDSLESGGEPPAARTAEPPAAEPSSGPARDASGKFATKAAPAADGADDPAAAQAAAAPADQGQAATGDAPRAPASWDPQAKADFATLPPHIQAQIAKREREITEGLTQSRAKAASANRWDELFAPHKARLAMRGIDQFQEVSNLLQARDILERDPVGGLRALAGSMGISLSQLTRANGQQQAAPQAQPQPQSYPQGLAKDVTEIRQYLTQQRQQQEAAAREQNIQTIQQFAADPAHLYYENVKGDMAALLRSGQAASLKDAYERAVWAHPDIRPILLKQQAAGAQATSQAAASAKVSRARSAAGSVTGSPTPGSSPAPKANPSASIADDISSAWDELVA